MSRTITIPSRVLAIRADQPLTPAMTSVIWELAAYIDRKRIRSNDNEAVWVEVPAIDLRGPGSRHDNVWLRECLDRMLGIKMSGEHRGDPWGAVLLAEWAIVDGGSTVRMLLPPTGLQALATPSRFVKIEAEAAHRLSGHGRKLYAILADKKNMNQNWWVFPLDELRSLMGVEDKKSYERFNNFRQFVLNRAITQINDYGTVSVKMTPQKRGRTVTSIRFDWTWKDPKTAEDTEIENERHSSARRKEQIEADAPPLTDLDDTQHDPAAEWWGKLTDAERETWKDHVGHFMTKLDGSGLLEINNKPVPRRDRDFAKQGFEAMQKGETPEQSQRSQNGRSETP